MGQRSILIDGYNVIRTSPGLSVAEERGGPPAGREALLGQLAGSFGQSADRIFVVFDGNGPTERRIKLHGVPHGHVIFTSSYETADDAIKRLCYTEEIARHAVVVVSSDAEVRREAGSSGAVAMRSEHLMRHLNQTPTYLRQRQRAKLGATWRDRSDENDGEPIPPSRTGNPHRAPRRRR
jgi:predicted RNA-binding protein with PIN domain